MENIKQKIVLPTRGVCNTTPDPICEDNELEDCVGFSYSDEAIRPIQDAKKLDLAADVGTLQYVHRLNDGISVNYIFVSGHVFIYGDTIEPVAEDATITGVSSVGNTLIINTEIGLMYYLWKPVLEEYKYLGMTLPEPDVDFRLYPAFGHIASFNTEDWLVLRTTGIELIPDLEDENDRRAWKDFVVGAYSSTKNKTFHSKEFVLPFMLRYGLELYDGTYCMLSNPIPFFPTVRKPVEFLVQGNIATFDVHPPFLAVARAAELFYKSNIDLSDWSDIVKNVTLFVSKPIELYDTEDAFFKTNAEDDIYRNEVISDAIVYDQNRDVHGYFTHKESDLPRQERFAYAFSFLCLKARSVNDIEADIKSTSVFYKLCDIGLRSNEGFSSTKEVILESVLDNITTQTSLNSDNNSDYYSHCQLHAGIMKTFNRRLNIASARRSFFDGFKKMSYYDSLYSEGINAETREQLERETYTTFRFYVTIETPEGNRVVVKEVSNILDLPDTWFYYPDPRAKRVRIYGKDDSSQWYLLKDLTLTEHRGLNGAYYLKYPSHGDTRPIGTIVSSFPTSDYTPESLNNYLLQSGVDNPFVFSASGYVRVGQGAILGLAALTTALSNDAYKVATTIAFTTQGIWGLEIDGEGVYKTVPPPFSRDVCSNPKSITMVDNGIYYVSKRGLMVVSDNANGCVTTQICGKNHQDYDSFTEFIQNCTCAYDYRDSQLWLINPDYDFHWVYSIKSGTLSRKEDGHSYEAVVSDYPDTLLQAEGSLFSMYQELNINDDETLYSGFFITRPMKFEQAMALKSLRDLKHIKDVSPEAEIVLTIYASNDCTSWQQLSSLKGRGFKYFKFRYDLTNLKAADAFCGTVLYYTTRLTDRIR